MVHVTLGRTRASAARRPCRHRLERLCLVVIVHSIAHLRRHRGRHRVVLVVLAATDALVVVIDRNRRAGSAADL